MSVSKHCNLCQDVRNILCVESDVSKVKTVIYVRMLGTFCVWRVMSVSKDCNLCEDVRNILCVESDVSK